MWTTDDLVTRVRRKCSITTTNAKLSTTDILAIADEETATLLWPALRRIRQDYEVSILSVPLVNGTALYMLPTRATAETIQYVEYDNGSGLRARLHQFPLGSESAYSSQTAAQPIGYVLEDSSIRPFPAPSGVAAGAALRVAYERRPSQLVATTAAWQVVSTTSTTIVVGTDITGTVGTETQVDVTRSAPPLSLVLDAATPTNVSYALGFTTLTFAASVDLSRIQEGDWMSLAYQTCIVQLPDALHPALVLSTAARALQELGDFDGSARVQADLDQRLGNMLDTLQPRVRRDPPFAFNRRSPGRMRFGWVR